MPRYEDYYNRCGMMLDEHKPRFARLSWEDKQAVIDEHWRRHTYVAELYSRTGEVIDLHDARFSDADAV